MSKKNKTQGVFRVFHLVAAGKKEDRRVYLKNDGQIAEFAKRCKARNWCRNHPGYDKYIGHPDGKVERYIVESEPDDGLLGGIESMKRHA